MLLSDRDPRPDNGVSSKRLDIQTSVVRLQARKAEAHGVAGKRCVGLEGIGGVPKQHRLRDAMFNEKTREIVANGEIDQNEIGWRKICAQIVLQVNLVERHLYGEIVQSVRCFGELPGDGRSRRPRAEEIALVEIGLRYPVAQALRHLRTEPPSTVSQPAGCLLIVEVLNL